MKKTFLLSVIILFVFAFMSLSCGGGGAGGASGQVDKLMSHYDNMIKIMKDNQNDPDKAIAELEAYGQKYQAEIEKLSEEMEQYFNDNPDKAMEIGLSIMGKVTELMELSQKLGYDMSF